MVPHCDAHVHIWPRTGVPDPSRLVTQATADVETLIRHMDAHGIQRAAVITPTAMGWNNSYTLDASSSFPDRLVFVARLPVSDTDSHVRSLVTAGCRGVRFSHDQPAFGSLAEQRLLLGALVDRDIPVNLHVDSASIPIAAQIAAAYPSMTILVDHCARLAPPVDTRGMHYRSLKQLAENPHVFFKIPNITFFSRSGHPYEDMRLLIRTLLHDLGPARMMWASDWPLSTATSPYRSVLTPAVRALSGFGAHEVEAFWRGNFERIYSHES